MGSSMLVPWMFLYFCIHVCVALITIKLTVHFIEKDFGKSKWFRVWIIVSMVIVPLRWWKNAQIKMKNENLKK